jgi:hypothetical protein
MALPNTAAMSFSSSSVNATTEIPCFNAKSANAVATTPNIAFRTACFTLCSSTDTLPTNPRSDNNRSIVLPPNNSEANSEPFPTMLPNLLFILSTFSFLLFQLFSNTSPTAKTTFYLLYFSFFYSATGLFQ